MKRGLVFSLTLLCMHVLSRMPRLRRSGSSVDIVPGVNWLYQAASGSDPAESDELSPPVLQERP